MSIPSRPLVLALLLATAAPAALARPKASGPASDAQRWAAVEAHAALQRSTPYAGLAWRSIGPVLQGGRVVDIENIPGNPHGFYVAYASGGVWKTTDNGSTFTPLSDQLASIVTGDIAVDPKAPQRLWIGSGEPNSSRSSYGGLGVFRSEDGGKTFRNMGLADTDRIARVWVDPGDGAHVCVAALGRLYSTGGSRGVFCTRDDGASWKQTLRPQGEWTGAIDLAHDPRNPEVLYAATWERSRTPWNFVESGAGSGIWKSVDGGDSWTRLGGGLPSGDKVGRIGLAVAPSNPDVVYASIDNWTELPESAADLGDRPLTAKRLKGMSKEEFLRQDPEEIESFIRDNDLDTALDAKALIAKVKADEIKVSDLVSALNDAEAALFSADIHGLEIWRSNDAGATWQRTHVEPVREVTYTYGYYFGTIAVAPDDAERVYVVGVPMIRSDDGGKSWVTMQHRDVHVDYHAWWIDPANPQRMLVGNDGGVDISYDGGRNWIKLDRQPVGQLYTLMLDSADPYNVYSGLQDNGTLKGSSRTRWEIGEDWEPIGGGDGMHVAVDTTDNKTVYSGYQFGYYQRVGPDGRHEVRPREALGEPALRYNWNTPVVLSPHQPDIVYYGAQKLFRSLDRGETWAAISSDLSTSPKRGDVPFATITSVSESPLAFGLVWAGTDDGHVWVTTSGGDRWEKVDAKLPAERWISRVTASGKVRERAYVALNGYRNDDITPYLYVTEDLGKSWRSIAAGLPAAPVNVVREDPVNADIVYAGTDRGVYVSRDRGARWQVLGTGLPQVPVHDFLVHPRERELVAATHGRSAWVVDVLPVQDLTPAIEAKAVHVFAINPVAGERDWRSRAPRWFDDSDYLPKSTISFWSGSDGEATVELVDANAQVVQRVTTPARRGLNQFTWDVRVNPELALAAEKVAASKSKETGAEGALARSPYAESVRLGHRLYAIPGKYEARVSVAGASATAPLEIKAPEARNPRAKPVPKIRGKDDYAGSVQRATPNPRAREHD